MDHRERDLTKLGLIRQDFQQIVHIFLYISRQKERKKMKKNEKSGSSGAHLASFGLIRRHVNHIIQTFPDICPRKNKKLKIKKVDYLKLDLARWKKSVDHLEFDLARFGLIRPNFQHNMLFSSRYLFRKKGNNEKTETVDHL